MVHYEPEPVACLKPRAAVQLTRDWSFQQGLAAAVRSRSHRLLFKWEGTKQKSENANFLSTLVLVPDWNPNQCVTGHCLNNLMVIQHCRNTIGSSSLGTPHSAFACAVQWLYLKTKPKTNQRIKLAAFFYSRRRFQIKATQPPSSSFCFRINWGKRKAFLIIEL